MGRYSDIDLSSQHTVEDNQRVVVMQLEVMAVYKPWPWLSPDWSLEFDIYCKGDETLVAEHQNQRPVFEVACPVAMGVLQP